MKSEVRSNSNGRCANGREIANLAAQFDLHVLDDAGVSEARDLAARLLVNDKIAPTETFVSIQRAAGAALLGHFEDDVLTGFMASFPLNRAGHDRLKAAQFDAVNLDLSLVCWDGEAPEAYYGWGFVASTKQAGRAVVKASAIIHETLFWATPTYARAVTNDGLRALTSLGFRPSPWGESQLLWIAPREAGVGR